METTITDYVAAALVRGQYELLEDGTYFATVPELPGVWGSGPNVEFCRRDLAEAIEGWLIVGLQHGTAIPRIGEVGLTTAPTA